MVTKYFTSTQRCESSPTVQSPGFKGLIFRQMEKTWVLNLQQILNTEICRIRAAPCTWEICLEAHGVAAIKDMEMEAVTPLSMDVVITSTLVHLRKGVNLHVQFSVTGLQTNCSRMKENWNSSIQFNAPVERDTSSMHIDSNSQVQYTTFHSASASQQPHQGRSQSLHAQELGKKFRVYAFTSMLLNRIVFTQLQ